MMTQPVLDPWEVAEADFPVDSKSADKLRFLLNYAVMAPSGHNTQPWRFKLTRDTIELYADRSKALPVVDPAQRELIMSCGAALFNLRLAMRYFGYKGQIEEFPGQDGDLLARVRLGETHSPTVTDKRLFDAMPQRRTNRGVFDDTPLPEALVQELQMAATQEGTWLAVVEREEVRSAIAYMIAEGDRLQWADEHYRRELAAWTHPNRSLRRDGIPAYAQGASELASSAGPLVIRTFDLGKGQAEQSFNLAMNALTLVVLGTHGDSAADWLAAGQALEHILLRARSAGVWASFMNQPIQVAAQRPHIVPLLEAVGYPHTILRLGYGQAVRPTPRLMVEDVLD